MNKDVTTGSDRGNFFKSIRVKESTKKRVNHFLEKINKSEDTGKVTFDELINYFIEKTTPEDIQSLQLKTITWVHEEKRLRKLYERTKGKTTDVKWKQMLCLGELKSFFNEHSRLPLNAN